jgi:hypothetical protein
MGVFLAIGVFLVLDNRCRRSISSSQVEYGLAIVAPAALVNPIRQSGGCSAPGCEADWHDLGSPRAGKPFGMSLFDS